MLPGRRERAEPPPPPVRSLLPLSIKSLDEWIDAFFSILRKQCTSGSDQVGTSECERKEQHGCWVVLGGPNCHMQAAEYKGQATWGGNV